MLCIFVNLQRLSHQHWPWRNGVNNNASISSFSNSQRRNKHHCELANCGRIEFPKLKTDAFTFVNCGMKKKDLIQVRNEFSPPTYKLAA